MRSKIVYNYNIKWNYYNVIKGVRTMGKISFKIVVSGDICVNLLQWRTDQQCTKGLNWQSYPHVHNSFKNGEALLLSKFVTLATQASIHANRQQKMGAITFAF